MSKQKRALITGITGQDGSYLAELLLSKGYEVHGIARRSSCSNSERINHILDLITIHNADLGDYGSLLRIVHDVIPDEVYNLAAQSFVWVSWRQPITTSDVTGVGATRMLEAVRYTIEKTGKNIKFYQASSSEMFGDVREMPQTEKTPFYPRSPYGVAKAYAHYMTVNYRESFNMFAVSGILFNHETNTPETPVLVRRAACHVSDWVTGPMMVMELGEIAPRECLRVDDNPGLEIWDNGKWVALTAISRYVEFNKPITRLLSRSGYVECTNGHVVCGEGGDKPIEKFSAGDRIAPPILPPAVDGAGMSTAMGWVLGFFVGDGSLHGSTARRNGRLEFFNKDIEKLQRVEANISLVDPSATFLYLPHPSSYKPGTYNHKLRVTSPTLKDLCVSCYVEKKPKAIKRVPHAILNASRETIEAFLDGYADADGTKSLPKTRYKFQYYTTKSQVLAAGLRLLCHWTGRSVTHNCERRENAESTGFYHKGFIRSRREDNLEGQRGQSGHNLMRDPFEVTKSWSDTASEFITVTTASGTYSAGTGLIHIHNSPRRGVEFSTRKISNAVARIKLGKQDKLFLGNMDAKRDWGFAGDYVKAMWLMLQQPEPLDFVVATGAAYSVRDFANAAFGMLDLNPDKYIEIDPQLLRPAEVNILCGNAIRAKEKLGWVPDVDFQGLVRMMVNADLTMER
jgi:GDPmannose 4,6-dehydratase